MKKRAGLLAVILGISCLCGCSELFEGYGNGYGKLNKPNESDPYMEIVSYSEVKEGYYLSDSGDGSYYLIKDGKFTIVGYDWEKRFRERNPRNEHSDMTDSEYEEFVSECVEEDIRNHTNKPFTPVKYLNYPEGFPYMMLITDPSPEEINLNGLGGISMGPNMKDENTLGTEPPFYVYCGTSLPESE